MNISRAYQSGLEKGIEKVPEPTQSQKLGEELAVQSIHNEWLKHQDTRELIAKLKLQRDEVIISAINKNKSAVGEKAISRLLSYAEQIDTTLKIIDSYGERNTERDS